MAKNFNVVNNPYKADIMNDAAKQHIGEMIERDPWFQKQDSILQQHLRDIFVNGNDGTVTNLGIAILNRQGITRVLDRTRTGLVASKDSVSSYSSDRQVNYEEKNFNIENGYRELNKQGFFSNIFKGEKKSEGFFERSQTPVSLAYENVRGYQIHQTTKQMMDALVNVYDQGGVAVGWDLETSGGVNVGKKNIGRHVTEFSFIKKNIIDDSQPEERFSSVIGATEEEYQEYLDIIEKYEKGTSDKVLSKTGGMPISQEERVTAERLAKMGLTMFMEEQDPGTAIDFTSDAAKRGIINFKKFVGDKDIVLMDPTMMRKGAEFIRKVGKIQEEAGKQNFTIGNKIYSVYGWESELLKGINAIQHGGINGSALTAIGHNTMTFDIGELNKLFSSDRVSSEAKQALSDIMGGKSFGFDQNLDTLALTRRFLPDNFFDDNDLQQMEKLGLTENQQESIVRRLTARVDSSGKRNWSQTVYEDPRNAGAAHMAITDVLRNLEMIKDLAFKEDSVLGKVLSSIPDSEEKVKLEAGSKGLFLAKSHLQEGKYNLLQLTRDALSGELRTSDGFSMAEGAKSYRTKEQLFGQTGIQKGVTYRINDIFEVKTGDKFHNIMKDMYPSLDIKDLTVLELQTYAPDIKDEDIVVKAKSPIYYVGSQQDIANAMMDNTFFIGELQDNGTINTEKVSDFTKQQLTRWKRTPDGNITKEEFNVNDIIADSAKRAQQESAARTIRQHDYKKDQKLLAFLDFEERKIAEMTAKMINGDTEDNRATARKELYKELWENSTKISRDMSLGLPIQRDELAITFNEYFGFYDVDTRTSGNLYSETLTAQMGRLEWARNNRPLLEAAATKARELAGASGNNASNGKDIIGYYYKNLLQGVEDYVEHSEGLKNSVSLGWQNQGIYGYEFNRKFDIDLSGYQGLEKGTIVSLNLESRPENMTDAILRASKGNLFTAKDYNVAERGAILRNVQQYLYKTGQLGHFTDDIITRNKRDAFISDTLSGKTDHSEQFINELRSQLSKEDPNWISNPYRILEGDSEAVASHKLLRSLQNKRESSFFAGHLTDTYRHMADPGAWKAAVSEEELEKVLSNIGQGIHKLTDIFSTDPRTNKEVISEQIVNDVVNNVLMDQRISDKSLEAAGYTDKEIKTLQGIRQVHKKGLSRYTRNIFEMIGNMGGSVGWDTKSRTIFAVLEGKTINLSMPKEVFVHGQAQYQLGSSLISMPIGIYDLKDGFGNKRELKATSIIEKAVATQESLIKWHERQALLGQGTKMYHLDKVISGISKTLRESPIVKTLDLSSRSNQFRIQYGDIFKNLPTLLGNDPSAIGSWHTDASYKKIIFGLTTGKLVYDPENPSYEQHLAMQANLGKLFDIAVQKGIISQEMKQTIFDNFTANIKASEKLAGQATYLGDWYSRFNGTKRNAAKIEDATQLNVSKISGFAAKADILEEEFGGLRDVGIGKGSTDRSTFAMSTIGSTEGRELNTHVQLTAIHTSPTGINALVMDNLGAAASEMTQKGSSVTENSMNLLATMMPEEGTGFMHGQVFDRIFSERDTIQKLGLRKIIDSDNNTIFNLQKKAAAMPIFDVITGKFSYGQGSFVTEKDIIGQTKGMSFIPHNERAKYEGLLKLGVFDIASGHLVEESEISRVIKESIDINEFTNLSDSERATKIVDLLEEKFNLAYYVQTEKANPLVKIAEMAEKGMTRALILGTGETNKDIAYVMDKLGFYGGNYVAQELEKDTEGNIIRKQLTKTLGKVDALDIKMIDSLLEDDLGSFGTAAKGRYQLLHGTELTDETLRSIIGEKFDSVQSFRQAIIKERYEPSRLMTSILQRSGVVQDKEAWHMITNHFANMKKHEDISAYRYLIDEWVYRENKGLLKSGQTAADLTKRYLLDTAVGEYKGTITKQGDTLIFSEAPKVIEANLSKLRKAYVDSGIVDFTTEGQALSKKEQNDIIAQYVNQGTMESGKISFTTQTSKQFLLGQGVFQALSDNDKIFTGLYEKSRGDFSRVGNYWDWAKDTYDAVKFNQRAITIMGSMRADEHGKENIRKFLEERAAANNGTGADIYDTFIKDLKKGEVINSAAIDQIYRNMFNRQGGGEALSGFIQKGINDELVWGINTGQVEKFVKRYNVGNGEVQKGINIMTALLGRMHQGIDGRSITTINEMGALNLWKAFSATTANSINTGQIRSEAEANRLGFKTIKLEDLLSGKLGAGDFDESLYGHNWLIDLGEHSAFGDDLWSNAPNNKSGRYLAIAANHIEDTDQFREAIADKPQEKVKLLQEDISKYLSKARDEGFEGEEERQQMFKKIIDRIQDIKSAQYNVWAGKGGIMAEATKAWMHDASRATARGMNLLGTESIDKAIQTDGLSGLMNLVQERRKKGEAIDISKLKINGISLVEEAQKGRNALQFSYSILSLERMNKIYDSGFVKISDSLVNAGIDKDTVNNLISEMSMATKKIAQTEGVEGISAREPLQYYGSVTQRKIFFNALASGNEAIGDFTSAQMRKEDYDSDAVVNALHKEQAELSLKGKKINIEVDSAMLSVLNSEKMKSQGISVRLLDEGAQQRFRNYQVSQFFTGAGEAQRYRVIADFKEGGYDFNFNSMSAEHLAEQIAPYDEKLSKQVLHSKDMTLGERKAYEEKLSEFLRDYYKKMVQKASFDYGTYGEDFLMASGETQRLRLLEQLQKGAIASGMILEPGSKYTNLGYEALRFSFHDTQLASDLVSHSGHIPTGKINRYTQNIYDVVNEVLHNEAASSYFKKDVGLLSGQLNLVNLAMQEGFLTPKNEANKGVGSKTAEELRAQLIPRLEKAYSAVFGLGDFATEADRMAVKTQLKDVMLDVVLQRTTKEMQRDPSLPTLQELMKIHGTAYGVNYKDLVNKTLGKVAEGESASVLEKTATAAVNNVVDFLVDNVGWRGNRKSIFSFATSHGSGNIKNNVISLPSESAQVAIQLHHVIGDTMKNLGVDSGVSYSAPLGFRKTQGESLDDFAERVTAKKNPPPDISEVPTKNPEVTNSLKRSVERSSRKGGGILSATIGIAGGLLISGFANSPISRPTAAGSAFGNTPIPSGALPPPPTELAQGSAASYGQRYPITYSDSNLRMASRNPATAYTINISANSPRGQQAALDAIQSSVGNAVPQNTAINVSMNNNYQDTLSQMQMNRMLMESMGF